LQQAERLGLDGESAYDTAREMGIVEQETADGVFIWSLE
jgi:predicted metalloprotease